MDGPFLFAGRLTQAKAVHVLRQAIEVVPDVSLFAAGDGQERGELYGPRVHALGALPRERVLELLAAADVVALSSARESFPHVLVEALAVGTPVIATAVGGVPEIVADGVNGLLVPPNDPEALAVAISRLLSDVDFRSKLAAEAVESVNRFSAAVVYRDLEVVLANAADSRRPS